MSIAEALVVEQPGRGVGHGRAEPGDLLVAGGVGHLDRREGRVDRSERERWHRGERILQVGGREPYAHPAAVGRRGGADVHRGGPAPRPLADLDPNRHPIADAGASRRVPRQRALAAAARLEPGQREIAVDADQEPAGAAARDERQLFADDVVELVRD